MPVPMTKPAVWTGILLLLLLDRSSAQDPGEPSVVRKTGTYVTVTCHDGDETLAEQALAVADAVWPIVADAFGVPDAKPEHPLDVHLYRTIEGYQAADQKLTGGKFRRNLAMSHFDTRSAHVALQPPCSDEALRALGLPSLTVTMLAWETTHVARFELCPDFQAHPEWFTDGFAAWVASEVLAAQRPATREATPMWAQDIGRVQSLRAARKLPPVRSILSDAVEDLDLHDRYATRVVFYTFLAGEPNRERLARVMKAIRGTGGGPGYAKAVLAAATRAFGGADKAFGKFVDDLRPEWEEVYRSLSTAGEEWAQIAFPDKNAIAWHRAPVQGGAFSAQGSLRILPGDARQMNFLFARTDDGFYSLAFVADSGFTLFDYRGKTEEWVRIGAGNAPGLRLGVSTEFAVEGEGGKLSVKLAGLSWDFDLPRPLPDAVVWGLGAQAGPRDAATGSAGLWQRVTVRPKTP